MTAATAATHPTTLQTPPTTSPTSNNDNNNNNKRRKKKRPSQPHVLLQQTQRDPEWCYIHLRHLTRDRNPQRTRPDDLDAVTAHLHLTTALQQFLGLHGGAIGFDVLRLEGRDVWIRARGGDRWAVVAAAGGWVSGQGEGWRVVGWSHWDAGVAGEGEDGGRDLFLDDG